MEIFDIACLGTSLTAGSSIDIGWQRDLELVLQVGKQDRVRTYNFGVPGGVTVNGIAKAPLAINMQPKAILIEFLMNDCLGTSTDCIANTISLLNILKAGSPGSKLFLMTMNPVVAGGTISASRVPVYPGFQSVYRDLATSQDVGLIDSYPDWAGLTTENMPDGIHPTSALNRTFLVPAIAAAIRPLMT